MASRAKVVQMPVWRDAVKRGAVRSGALVGSVALIIAALLFAVALVSYRPSDPAMNTAAAGPANNWIGPLGAWTSDIMLWLSGPAVMLLVPVVLITAVRLWRDVPVSGWRRRLAWASMSPAALRRRPGQQLIGVGLASVQGRRGVRPSGGPRRRHRPGRGRVRSNGASPSSPTPRSRASSISSASRSSASRASSSGRAALTLTRPSAPFSSAAAIRRPPCSNAPPSPRASPNLPRARSRRASRAPAR